jgi:AraC family transcriptional regulator, transcriptional activator FtrA
MRAVKKPTTSRGRQKHVIAVLVAPDSVALEIAMAQHIFGPVNPAIAEVTANSDTPYEVVLCGEVPRCVLATGVDPGELSSLDVLGDADTVIVPGVQNPLAKRSAKLLDSLRIASSSGVRMVGFCGGAFLLGYAGVLDRRRATTHWLLAPEFRAAFPHVRLDVDRLYVDDPPVHTSGGMFAATDLSLHLLAMDQGQAAANDMSRILVSAPYRKGGQAQFILHTIRTETISGMDGLLTWLREHLDEPLTLAGLARHEHISERSLVRKFRQATGMSVFDWIARERVDRAKMLLETTDFAIGDIAAMAGFGSPESFRRNFEKSVGTTAGSYRRTFRGELASPHATHS